VVASRPTGVKPMPSEDATSDVHHVALCSGGEEVGR